MSRTIRIKKGHNIRIQGKAEKIFKKAEHSGTYAVKPQDFCGLTPKLCVAPGDQVKTGSVLFYNKHRPEIKITAPVSGTVSQIKRGERRRILEVIIDAENELQHNTFASGDPLKMTRDEIIGSLLSAGLWPMIRQRPYAVIADPATTPKSVFIPCFDTAPLAPDYDFVVKGENEAFQIGINALSKLTDGKINITLNAEYPSSDVFTKTSGTEITFFSGPHPAGSVGVQIHHIDPVNKGDIVWYLFPQDVITIGKLFGKGIYDSSRIVALTGSEVEKPIYYKTRIGADISSIHENKLKPGQKRFISGNVLTGTQVEENGYLGFYDSQITVIPEGNQFEFLGWAMPGLKKYSTSRSFCSWMRPGGRYRINTNFNGGERAFVMSGEYER
ncbi:MAG: Na(+)-translocating NADH-quinone reductase subunit A, partial [Bacteroidetes bacterium]|nr:Na(+)-translocating NADH-quinone reductase subunit A [Bacteroidota bacterium]